MNNLNLKKQMPKNLAMNIISFATNVVIGLWLVPYLVNHLGTAAYGLVPLAMVFTQYVSIITQSLNSAINRFLSIAVQKQDKQEAGEIFNTSLVLLGIFSLIQLPLIGYIVYDLSFFVSVPDGLLSDASWLFGLTFTGFLISLLRSVFAISMYSRNRLDLLRMNDVVRVVTRVIIIVFLFSIDKPALKYIGIANLAASLVVFLLAVFYCHKLTPDLKLNLNQFNRKRVRDLSGMGSWLLVNQVGYLLFVRVDLYLINRFIGPGPAGEYAAIMQWSMLVHTMAGVLSGVIGPLVMIYYARGEINKMVATVKFAVKVLSVIIAIILAMLCACPHDLIAIWLGESFRHLGWLLVLQLFHLVVNAGVLPLFSINTTLNKVRWPGTITLIMGVMNLALALIFIKYTNWGYYGVAAAGALVLILKNSIFTPLYASHILGLPKRTFLSCLLVGAITFTGVTLITIAFKNIITPTNLISLSVLYLVSALCSIPIVIYYFFKKERDNLLDIF
jgi:O-antigen/teichoic acid export membrane protein